jgi:hypothetical protein
MRSDVYRYQFASDVPIAEVEASLVLAQLAAEALHGETELQLVAPHYLDVVRRTCVVDGSTPAGNDFNRVFLGFLRREFGTAVFCVEAISPTNQAPATAA